MADIFLSYTREDAEAAARLAERLVERGWSVFWDRSIAAGSLWDEVIEGELRASTCVVVLWSKASVKSQWVRTEANFGLKAGTLVPASLDGTDPPLAFQLVEAAQLQHWMADPRHPEFLVLTAGIARCVGAASVVSPPGGSPDAGPLVNTTRGVTIGRPGRLPRAAVATAVATLLLLTLWGIFQAGERIGRERNAGARSDDATVTGTTGSELTPDVSRPAPPVDDGAAGTAEPPGPSEDPAAVDGGRRTPPRPPRVDTPVARGGGRPETKQPDRAANGAPQSGDTSEGQRSPDVAAIDKTILAPELPPSGSGESGDGREAGVTTPPESKPPDRADVERRAAADRAGIQDVIERFRNAYNARNLDAARSVYRSAGDNVFQENRSCSRVTLSFVGPLDVDLYGDRAVVKVDSTYACIRATAQRGDSPKVTDIFEMVREQDSWTISSWLTPVR